MGQGSWVVLVLLRHITATITRKTNHYYIGGAEPKFPRTLRFSRKALSANRRFSRKRASANRHVQLQNQSLRELAGSAARHSPRTIGSAAREPPRTVKFSRKTMRVQQQQEQRQ